MPSLSLIIHNTKHVKQCAVPSVVEKLADEGDLE